MDPVNLTLMAGMFGIVAVYIAERFVERGRQAEYRQRIVAAEVSIERLKEDIRDHRVEDVNLGNKIEEVKKDLGVKIDNVGAEIGSMKTEIITALAKQVQEKGK